MKSLISLKTAIRIFVFWPFAFLHSQTMFEKIGEPKSDVFISISPEGGHAMNFGRTQVFSDKNKRLDSYSNPPYHSLLHGFGIDIRNKRYYASLGWRKVRIGNFLQISTKLENNNVSIPLQLPVYRNLSLFDFHVGYFKTWSKWILTCHIGLYLMPYTYLDQNVNGMQGYSDVNGKDSIVFMITGTSLQSNNFLPKLGMSFGRIFKIQKSYSITVGIQFQYAQGWRDVYFWSTNLSTGRYYITMHSRNKGTLFASTLNISFPLARLYKLSD